MNTPMMTHKYVKVSDLTQAVTNWQNAVGTEFNGQLEAFLGTTLGAMTHAHYTHTGLLVPIDSDSQIEDRIKILLNENHPTMIKVWLARNK